MTAAILALAGCSADGDSATTVGTASTTTAFTTGDEELFTDSDDEGTVAADPADPADSVEPVVESLDPVSETGVPGLDSPDAFCSAWSAFAGSIQALSLAWTEQPPMDAATLEVAASDALSGAVDGLANNLPAEIESNRQAFTVDFPSPWLRRAQRARNFLVDEGADALVIEELGVAWLAAIASAGVDAPDVEVEMPLGAEEALPAAASAFVNELPSVVADPSLNTTSVDISPSFAYIADNCPDQATLAGNDNVDGS